MHGAPGSQNVSYSILTFRKAILIETCPLNEQGFDNSGRRGSANWADDQRNVDRTRGVVQSLASEFSNGQYYGVVTAIVSDSKSMIFGRVYLIV